MNNILNAELSKLTRDDINSFDFVTKTPAGGIARYDKELDIATVDYGRYTRVYYDRNETEGVTACCFRNSFTIQGRLNE